MPTSTNVTNLKINELTEAQYDAAVLNGTIGVNELSVLTDAQVGQIIQVSSMPTAAAGEEGNIYQFVGTTDANYTNGYFYKCVSDGQTPATYSWIRVDVQPTPSGLPSQTGNAGKFLTTDGTDASWSDKPLVNTATGTDSLTVLGTAATNSHSINIGSGSSLSSATNQTVVGDSAKTVGSSSTYVTVLGAGAKARNASRGIAIGAMSDVNATGAIQIGTVSTGSSTTNSDANTFKVANANGNFEMMDANGNLPAGRLAPTTGLADGNYRLRLTMASGIPTLTWVAE